MEQFVTVGAIEGIAISEDGSLVAVSTSLPLSSTQQNKGRIYLYEWAATSVAAPSIVETVQAGIEVAVAPDGSSVAALAGDDHVRVRRSGTNVTDTGFPNLGSDVAISASNRHLSVAGSMDGWFALYSDDTAKDLRDLRLRDESNPITSVAIRRDATALAVGNTQGDIWVYAVDPAVPIVDRLIGTVTLAGAINDVQFARDGLTLAAVTPNTVAHYAVTSTGLRLLWESPRAGGYAALGVEEAGELVATANGTTATLYDARHSVAVSAPANQPNALPNTTGAGTFTVRNSGNRLETIALQVVAPSPWAATLSNASLTLAPNQTATVEARWALPAFQGPGTEEVTVRATLVGRSVPGAEATLQVTTPEVRGWDLEAVGPLSLGVRLGQATPFTATLRNMGNIPMTPPLALTVSDARWTAARVGANQSVAPGETIAIVVELTPPSNAAELATATATLAVTGFPGETLTFTGTVGASFAVLVGAPPGVEVPAGNSTRVALTLRNTGNAVDGILVQVGALPTGWAATFLDGRTIYEVQQVNPGESVVATLEVHAPAAASATPVSVTVTAQSMAAPTQSSSTSFLATAVEPTTSQTDTDTDGDGGGKGDGIPGPGIALVTFALVSLALLRRRL